MRDVFISHAEEDANVSKEIANGLEGEGYTTWYYERDGDVPGIPHLDQSREAIEQSRAVILVISTHSIESHEVNTEVLYAHEIKKPIIPVRIDISHEEFKKRQPRWHFVIPTTVSVSISKEDKKEKEDIHSILPQIIKGLKKLEIYPSWGKIKQPCRRCLINITPPEPNFVGRTKLLKTITKWYKNLHIHIGALIGWGGEGKSSIARKWYDSMEENNIQPAGIFWWGFYRNAYLDRFLDSLLEFLAHGRVDLNEIKSTWAKVNKINGIIQEGEYLIILERKGGRP
jgi:hypothetical protein